MRKSQKEIIKSLLPAILFMVVYKFYSYKIALGVGLIFGATIYISEYRKHRKLSSMDKLGLFGLIIQSVLGALASNPKVYFVYPLIENIVFAVIFIGSLFTKNNIISLFAKDYASDDKAYEIMKPAYYRLTLIWGVFFLIKAIIKGVGIMSWSFELLYSVNWILGTPLSVVLLWFSFNYPNIVYKKYNSGNEIETSS
jgi:intracellular septation protein A